LNELLYKHYETPTEIEYFPDQMLQHYSSAQEAGNSYQSALSSMQPKDYQTLQALPRLEEVLED
jgi:hypothetical protein